MEDKRMKTGVVIMVVIVGFMLAVNQNERGTRNRDLRSLKNQVTALQAENRSLQERVTVLEQVIIDLADEVVSPDVDKDEDLGENTGENTGKNTGENNESTNELATDLNNAYITLKGWLKDAGKALNEKLGDN